MSFSEDIYLSFDISISFSSASECNSFEKCFDEFVILSDILLTFKSPVASAVFWIALFIVSIVDFLALSRSFWLYLLLKCAPMFLAND